MRGSTRQATMEDVLHVSAHLRECDRLEAVRSTGLSPDEVSLISFESALWCQALLGDDEPVGIYGLTQHPTEPDTGIPWFFSTDKLQHLGGYFLRHSRENLRAMLQDRPVLCNIVDAEHAHSIRWLSWLGFTIEPAQLLHTGYPFHFFHTHRGRYV